MAERSVVPLGCREEEGGLDASEEALEDISLALSASGSGSGTASGSVFSESDLSELESELESDDHKTKALPRLGCGHECGRGIARDTATP